MRLFICGEHPINHSGFSQLTHHISQIIDNEMKYDGCPISDVTTIGYSRGTNEEFPTKYRLINAATPSIVGSMQGTMMAEDGKCGMHTLRTMLRNTNEKCIVLTIGDPWTFWYMKTTKLMFPKMKWISYLPVESTELVDVAKFSFPGRNIECNIGRLYSYADKIIGYTKNGMNVVQKLVGKDICNSFIYHGIDNKRLRSIEPREFRRLKDKFVVGTVCRNGWRKALDVLLIGFANFIKKWEALKKKGPEPVLLLHTPRHDVAGWDLPSLARKLGIEKYILISDMLVDSFKKTRDPRTGRINSGVKKGASLEDLVSLYKAMDVYINVSRGEGFGIPVIEAMSLGVPVAYIDHANLGEICECKGIPIEVGGYEYKENYEIQAAIANPESIGFELAEMYKYAQKQDAATITVPAGIKFTNELDWNGASMIKQWKDAIKSTAEDYEKEEDKTYSNQRVIALSTYNVECGIATYTENLINNLQRIDKRRDYLVLDDTSDPEKYLDLILDSDKATIIHIQYEPNLFSPEKLMPFMAKLKSLSGGKIKTVLTMHQENERSIRGLDGIADSIILHSDMFNIGNSLKYTNIIKAQHPFYTGIEIMRKDARDKVRADLGFKEDDFVIGTTGFLLSYKMILQISKQIIDMMKDRPKYALLLPVSRHRNDSAGFANNVVEEIMSYAKENGVGDRVVIKLGFHEQSKLVEYLQCLDIGWMFVNNQAVGANSGSVRMLISSGVPCIVAGKGKMHHELYKLRCTLSVATTNDPVEFIKSGLEFADGQPDLIKSMRTNCIQAAARFSFTAFAAMHKTQIYDRLFTQIQIATYTTQEVDNEQRCNGKIQGQDSIAGTSNDGRESSRNGGETPGLRCEGHGSGDQNPRSERLSNGIHGNSAHQQTAGNNNNHERRRQRAYGGGEQPPRQPGR